MKIEPIQFFIDEDSILRFKLENEDASDYDSLTGLFSRDYFFNKVIQTLKENRLKQYAVLFINLSDFTYFVHSYGESVCEQILKIIARRIISCLGGTNMLVARTGYDEYGVFLEQISSIQELEKKVRAVSKIIELPLCFHHEEMMVKSHIGIAFSPENSAIKGEELLKNAGLALSESKRSKSPYSFSSSQINAQIKERFILEQELKKAVESRKGFFLVYQPQVDMKTRKLSGFEALVRWKDKSGKIIPPDQFIKLAEENGMIVPLGELILDIAFKQIKAWEKRLPKGTSVSVNLSVRQLVEENFLDMLLRKIKKVRLNPTLLNLEVTESILIENLNNAKKMLQKLVDFGINVTIDDFGVGYSSFSSLYQLPLHKMKIDRSFLKDLNTEPKVQKILKAMIQLGHLLDLKVIVEGIEDEKDFELVRSLGADCSQGFYTGKPLSVEDAEKLF